MFDITRGMLMIAVVLGHSITAYVKYWEPQFTMHWWYCFLILFKPVIYGGDSHVLHDERIWIS